MPIITDNMSSQTIAGSNFTFSATRIDSLGAAEYTLVTLMTDVSGSVGAYQTELVGCIKAIVAACSKSPRADNLLLRLVTFDQRLTEVHGFKPLTQCNPEDYNNALRDGGMTALFDASFSAIEAGNQYGRDLTAKDFEVNAIVFVITDGQDNASKFGASKVKAALEAARTGECVESLVSILIGVGAGAGGGNGTSLDHWLLEFKDDVGFTQYVPLADASVKTLTKLADFVSKSISAQSQSLGTGGASTSLSL